MEVTAPTLELLTWVEARRRTYADVVDAWRSNCPRLAIWDDAVNDGLVRATRERVELTERGRTLLATRASSTPSLD